MKVLVTGANGFVGRALIPHLIEQGDEVVAASRDGRTTRLNTKNVAVGDIGPATDWREAVIGCDAVVHLAGRAHVMEEGGVSPLYEQINVHGTRQLFLAAATSGVTHFIFASSIKAVGERSAPDQPLDEEAPCHPEDDYGKSKRAAEKFLTTMAIESKVTLSILRFPLVYGAGVAANMGKLFDAVRRGSPIPHVMPANLRSFISIGNLVSAIATCLSQPKRAGGIFHLSDGVDLSTAGLAREMGHAVGRKPFLIPAPLPLLTVAGWLGDIMPPFPINSGMVRRLAGSLQVESSKFRATFNWHPPYTPAESFRKMVEQHEQ